MRGPIAQPQQVRHHQAHEPDQAREAHPRAHDQRAQRHDAPAHPGDLHAQVPGLALPQRHQIQRHAVGISQAIAGIEAAATMPRRVQSDPLRLPRLQSVTLRSWASSAT